jgi:uncharacterized heparinase superfamily protein
MENVGLYLRTLRHLKLRQVTYRLWRTKPRRIYSASPAVRTKTGIWTPSIPRAQAHLGGRRFQLLNEERDIAGWNDPAASRLWLYNLHYFEHPEADLIRTWIAENPEGEGAGWEPYPLSLRIVNWIKWALNGGELDRSALNSLLIQTGYLRHRLEYHLLGNHLLANAKALIFAGCFLAGAEAESWLSHGTQILRNELEEQILSDGAHFERSPMYHSLILEDLLDLINLSAVYPRLVLDCRDKAALMLGWLENMIHPDGRIPLFNDAAFDVAPEPASIFEYARRLGVRTKRVTLGESGYIRLEAGPAVVIFDAGPIGPDYQPGHGHADTLSFELSYDGERMIVDSGTSTYYPLSAERLRQRGTMAHNTVTVDRQDQSEIWDVFRVGHRARVFDVRTNHHTYAEAAHDGYAWRKPKVIHRRRLKLRDTHLDITDCLEGHGYHEAESRYHLHPRSSVKVVLDPVLNASSEISTYHPGFNVAIPNTAIVGQWRGQCPVSFHTKLIFMNYQRQNEPVSSGQSG